MGIGPVLETAIAVIFIYIVLSLIAIGLTELYARVTKLRAKTLQQGLRELVNTKDRDLVGELYKNYLIKGLSGKQAVKNDVGTEELLPTTIPNRNFAQAFIQTVADKGPQVAQVTNQAVNLAAAFAREVNSTANPVLGSLRPIVAEAAGDVTRLRTRLEEWFDISTTTLSEHYRNHTKLISFFIGLGLALLINADTFTMVSRFYGDEPMRAQAVAAAEAMARNGLLDSTAAAGSPADATVPDSARARPLWTARQLRELNNAASLRLPLGWNKDFRPKVRWNVESVFQWFIKLLGCAFTAGAISLGAPFWYDILQRLVGIRTALKKKDEEPAAG